MEAIVRVHLHAHPWTTQPLRQCLQEVITPTLQEPGCLDARVHESPADVHGFVLETRWTDESAFRRHAGQAHTEGFLTRVKPLLDQDLRLELSA